MYDPHVYHGLLVDAIRLSRLRLLLSLSPMNHCFLQIYLLLAVLRHRHQAPRDLASALLYAAEPEGDVEAKADVVQSHVAAGRG